jgi:hypothetical protein
MTRAERANETFSEKFMRKFKRDPLIPIGARVWPLSHFAIF